MEYFSMKQISFKLILAISAILFFVCYYLDTVIDPSKTESVFVVGYMFAIMLAAFWSILNYIDHLRINPLYKSYHSIEEFIGDLSVSTDEKNEIETMMIDYVYDQKKLGNDENQAIKDIIQQFKRGELTEKDVFFVHIHKYLLGLGLILLSIAGIIYFLGVFIPAFQDKFFIVLGITTLCYSLGFYLSFFMYNILNKILIRK
ncbi:hypothetical protein [Companilactobacillus keshanensis]|uniref:Uncharacterized protein n=1 Tax=Companilactobacillus keshanensis TaxID=2486003 RepID=A0ABW4BWK5_9LACO|nr:hypothetical protein [Companilactobacillus keshanensis]